MTQPWKETMSKTVYVVMGNDTVYCVLDNEESAESYIAKRYNEQNKEGRNQPNRIHWRYYEFDLKS